MAITPLSISNPLAALNRVSSVDPGQAASAATDGGFGDALKSLLQTMDGTTGAANDAVSKMIGGTGDVHDAMIALQRAEMTMQLTVQIRNKLVAAYHDVMRMPI